MFQTGDVVYGEGKLRDLGIVFKPSFKCLKNKIINLSPAILKLETLLYQNIYIYIYYFILHCYKKKCPKDTFSSVFKTPFQDTPDVAF